MKTNFFYNDRFYTDIEELMLDLEIDEENIEEADDFYVCFEAKLEPMFKLDENFIIDNINEERFTEDGNEIERIEKLIKETDFSEFNSKVPKLWYETRIKFEITKADLYEHL